MADSLADDALKLIAYTIVFAKRGKEGVMPHGEGTMVETENLTEEEFVARLIATYVAKNRETNDFRKLVKTTADLRFLKVYYVVSTRWPREPLEADSRQAEALEAVRDSIGTGE
jgi:hypothetical protein